MNGVGKIVDFRHLSRRISEAVQRVQVAIDHYGGMCTSRF